MKFVCTWITCIALMATLFVRAAGASDYEQKRFYLTPLVGWTYFDSDRQYETGQQLQDDYYFGGRAGVRLTHMLGFEAAGGYASTKDCLARTESWTHISGNIVLGSAGSHTINPFLSVGGGWSKFHHVVSEREKAATFEAAGGVRVRLSEALGLRVEARNVLALAKLRCNNAHLDEKVLAAGLTLSFGGKPKDTDLDGVPDKRDDCPNTPMGCHVDIHGCPIDSDGDGVCDGVDQCPDTPKGCTVDARGCPMDSDGDGVCDGADQCADSPKGCTVDLHGCPVDADGDGVCDGLDQCANTVKGCTVDEKGCPRDSDGDGVCDGLDKCPNTPAGTPVDVDGCPVVVEREKQLEMEMLDTGMIRISNINFDYDKATIRPDAFAVLDTVGRVLTKWPGLKIEIDGHTDSRGRDAYNLNLSHRRAESVRVYLLAHFSQFQADQITSKGFGESRPLVPNTSQANMQINRRVEFVALNKELLKRVK